MSGFWDFMIELGKSELVIDIPQKVVNHYYITIDNRKIEVTQEEFMKLAKQSKIAGKNNILIGNEEIKLLR